MTRKAVKIIFLSKLADFFNGMATAWAFASYDALIHLVLWDLIISASLAILCFSLSVGIGIKLKTYDKHSRHH
jgi:hypothetical protein